MSEYHQQIQHAGNPELNANRESMNCRCDLEQLGTCFNCLSCLLVVALIVFMFGSNAWCSDSDDLWCDAFGGQLGILWCLLLMFGLCCSPCFCDLFISALSKTTTRFKAEPFDSRYANIHDHTFTANEECVKNNEKQLQRNGDRDEKENDRNKQNRPETFSADIAYKIPIIYSTHYNITAWGIEKIHPFDSEKYGRIHGFISSESTFNASQIIKPPCASRADLLTVHSMAYLCSLTSSWAIMKILELPGICLLPAPILNWRCLTPMLCQVGGSILGVEFAYKYGWCINLGGGFHHASATQGGGFCVFADITIAIQYIRCSLKNVNKRNDRVLIIDLDAHQGNGHERDVIDFFGRPSNLKVLDAYNARIYPGDVYAKQGIEYDMALFSGCDDEHFLSSLRKFIQQAMQEFRPQFIVYNAGTDCLVGDPLGAMRISADGIQQRDEIVFSTARENNVPVLMVLSGGYQRNNARVIADSIQNLYRKQLLRMNR